VYILYKIKIMSSKITDFTSGSELKAILDGEVRVIPYYELASFPTLEALLEPYGKAIILYEQEDNLGHWVCISYGLEEGTEEDEPWPYIKYFDSYGITPDSEQDWVNPEYRKKRWNNMRYLSLLMKNSPYEIDYNDHDMQSKDPKVGTCGKWCFAYLSFPNFDADEFHNLFKSDPETSADDLVNEFWNDAIRKKGAHN
jgi:hypothetical protein